MAEDGPMRENGGGGAMWCMCSYNKSRRWRGEYTATSVHVCSAVEAA